VYTPFSVGHSLILHGQSIDGTRRI